MNFFRVFRMFPWIFPLLWAACASLDDYGLEKSTGLIVTPAGYYSTPKARYLATKYKDTLDRIVGQISANPKTASLRFANNISSVGGVGFFTHSAAQTPDERYLEVVLATPESFESHIDNSEKVQRLFALYGAELLKIMSADAALYQDQQFAGYGLNLSWQNVGAEPARNPVGLERAILYFPKAKVRSLMRQELGQNEFLASAVIFAVAENGPLQLVSYRPQAPRAEAIPVISEHNLSDGAGSHPRASVEAAPSINQANQTVEKPEKSAPQLAPSRESDQPVTAAAKAQAVEAQAAHVSAASHGAASAESTKTVPDPIPIPAPLNLPGARAIGEQLVARGPTAADSPPPTRPAPQPRALAGYIVQLAFDEKDKAQRWAESMEKRGHAVSVTEAGNAGPVRVRVGNFDSRDDAERQLRAFKLDGLNGIVVNLPQSFQPVARASAP